MPHFGHFTGRNAVIGDQVHALGQSQAAGDHIVVIQR